MCYWQEKAASIATRKAGAGILVLERSDGCATLSLAALWQRFDNNPVMGDTSAKRGMFAENRKGVPFTLKA